MANSGKHKYTYVNDEEEVRYSFQWLLHWATPTSQCDVYAVCGAFGLCDVASSQYCRCFPGFGPATSPPGDWSGGCARRTTLRCVEGAAPSPDGFLPVQNVKLPSNYFSAADAGIPGDCASACLSNSSCTAYAYNDGRLVWHGDLRNVQQLPTGAAGASTLFLRLAAADLAALAAGANTHGSRTRNLSAILAAASSLALLMILCLFFVLAWLRRRRERTIRHEGSLLVFTHGYLARCTKNFSHKLGMGSFGSVYRGTLPDRTGVAMKRLEGSAQGEKQFRAESFGRLDWRARYRIMAGVARGLTYLHEQCQERIVHCDVKPEKILLDEGFRPKVADFGMAKLIGRDFSRALTTTRGTLGYLAPEWFLGMPVTPKADVFSYGMTLLELISGRRNRDGGGSARAGGCYFPLWAAARVGEGRLLEVLDERLQGEADMEELGRACNVACWCIQQTEEVRPTMGQVVQVLEGSLGVGVAPVPRYLEQFCVVDSSCTFELD
ncbi:hypothetical protein E2562_026376 [Oryza meyeriana var. granulata]|uniref:Protein kinase domain-containing protein n=1 Tax=Oryza meyeriana var. granulata TaxID=110450 RepID=A0A6G1DQP5_9ORYZ|nr:hypothetical protein E2562_026376 [Oryza meyeriana var. granulata]